MVSAGLKNRKTPLKSGPPAKPPPNLTATEVEEMMTKTIELKQKAPPRVDALEIETNYEIDADSDAESLACDSVPAHLAAPMPSPRTATASRRRKVMVEDYSLLQLQAVRHVGGGIALFVSALAMTFPGVG